MVIERTGLTFRQVRELIRAGKKIDTKVTPQWARARGSGVWYPSMGWELAVGIRDDIYYDFVHAAIRLQNIQRMMPDYTRNMIG